MRLLHTTLEFVFPNESRILFFNIVEAILRKYVSLYKEMNENTLTRGVDSIDFYCKCDLFLAVLSMFPTFPLLCKM